MIRLSAFSDEAGAGLAEQIEALQANGISMTELRSVEQVNVQDLSLATARDYAARLASEGIGVSAIGSPIGKICVREDLRAYEEKLKHVCELAEVLGTEKIRVFSFYEAWDERERVLDAMRRMVEIAATFGVTLYHENEKGIYGDTAERVMDLYKNVPGLCFVYDPANFLQVGESAARTLREVLPICTHFHMKDVDAASGELVPVGYGSGRVDELLGALPEDAILTLEPHLAVFSGYAEIDGAPMKHRFRFAGGREAFDCAAQTLIKALLAAGYTKTQEGFVR